MALQPFAARDPTVTENLMTHGIKRCAPISGEYEREKDIPCSGNLAANRRN